MGDITAAHIIFIPAVLLVGIVVGWVLGSRAAQDAYAAELRRRDQRARGVTGAAGVRGEVGKENGRRGAGDRGAG
jgi:hypothetical protein